MIRQLSAVWTYDHLVGAVAAGAAVVAAIYSVKGLSATRSAADSAGKNWQAEIRPLVSAQTLGIGTDKLSIMLANSGGAAQPAVVGAISQSKLFGGHIALGAHVTAQVHAQFPQLIHHDYGRPDGIFLIVARDAGGKWWDMSTGGPWMKIKADPGSPTFLQEVIAAVVNSAAESQSIGE